MLLMDCLVQASAPLLQTGLRLLARKLYGTITSLSHSDQTHVTNLENQEQRCRKDNENSDEQEHRDIATSFERISSFDVKGTFTLPSLTLAAEIDSLANPIQMVKKVRNDEKQESGLYDEQQHNTAETCLEISRDSLLSGIQASLPLHSADSGIEASEALIPIRGAKGERVIEITSLSPRRTERKKKPISFLSLAPAPAAPSTPTKVIRRKEEESDDDMAAAPTTQHASKPLRSSNASTGSGISSNSGVSSVRSVEQMMPGSHTPQREKAPVGPAVSAMASKEKDKDKDKDDAKGQGGRARVTAVMQEREQIGDYILMEKLGKGAYGVVHKALHITEGNIVAVKQLNLKGASKDVVESYQAEISLLKSLNHPNIVRYIDHVKKGKELNIVMEYVEGGSLAAMVKKYGRFPEPLARTYVGKVLVGLCYLHEQGVIHRDVKPDNILITKEGDVKLADFGVSTKLNVMTANKIDDNAAPAGTPYYMAPEVIEFYGARTESDIWSLGCTIVELLRGQPPYFQCDPFSAMYKMVADEHPPLPSGITMELNDFLLACFTKDVNYRPSAEQILSHSWLKSAMKSPAVPSQTKTMMTAAKMGTVNKQDFSDIIDNIDKYNEELESAITHEGDEKLPAKEEKKELPNKGILGFGDLSGLNLDDWDKDLGIDPPKHSLNPSLAPSVALGFGNLSGLNIDDSGKNLGIDPLPTTKHSLNPSLARSLAPRQELPNKDTLGFGNLSGLNLDDWDKNLGIEPIAPTEHSRESEDTGPTVYATLPRGSEEAYSRTLTVSASLSRSQTAENREASEREGPADTFSPARALRASAKNEELASERETETALPRLIHDYARRSVLLSSPSLSSPSAREYETDSSISLNHSLAPSVALGFGNLSGLNSDNWDKDLGIDLLPTTKHSLNPSLAPSVAPSQTQAQKDPQQPASPRPSLKQCKEKVKESSAEISQSIYGCLPLLAIDLLFFGSWVTAFEIYDDDRL